MSDQPADMLYFGTLHEMTEDELLEAHQEAAQAGAAEHLAMIESTAAIRFPEACSAGRFRSGPAAATEP